MYAVPGREVVPQRGARPVAVWTTTQTAPVPGLGPRHRLYAAYHLTALRGLRRGEAAGLRWRDVDLHGKTVVISRQLQQHDGRLAVCPPKMAHSTRVVALDRTTVATLAEPRTVLFQAYPLRQALATSSGRKCPDWPERTSNQGDGGQIIAEPGTAASGELMEGVTAKAVGVIADARPRPHICPLCPISTFLVSDLDRPFCHP